MFFSWNYICVIYLRWPSGNSNRVLTKHRYICICVFIRTPGDNSENNNYYGKIIIIGTIVKKKKNTTRSIRPCEKLLSAWCVRTRGVITYVRAAVYCCSLHNRPGIYPYTCYDRVHQKYEILLRYTAGIKYTFVQRARRHKHVSSYYYIGRLLLIQV